MEMGNFQRRIAAPGVKTVVPKWLQAGGGGGEIRIYDTVDLVVGTLNCLSMLVEPHVWLSMLELDYFKTEIMFW